MSTSGVIKESLRRPRNWLYGESLKFFLCFWMVMWLLYYIDFLHWKKGEYPLVPEVLSILNIIMNPFFAVLYLKVVYSRIIKDRKRKIEWRQFSFYLFTLISFGVINSLIFNLFFHIDLLSIVIGESQRKILGLDNLIWSNFDEIMHSVARVLRNFPEAIFAIISFLGAKIMADYIRYNKELETDKERLNRLTGSHELENFISLLSPIDDLDQTSLLPFFRKLRSFISYLVHEAVEDTVLLSVEIEHLKNYAELKLLKFKPGEIDLVLSLPAKISQNWKIVPGIFIEIIRNAFKHVDRKSVGASIDITFTISAKGYATLVVRNSCVPDTNTEMIANRQIGKGLLLIEQYAKIYYPNRSEVTTQLITKGSQSYFQVEIKLLLDD